MAYLTVARVILHWSRGGYYCVENPKNSILEARD